MGALFFAPPDFCINEVRRVGDEAWVEYLQLKLTLSSCRHFDSLYIILITLEVMLCAFISKKSLSPILCSVKTVTLIPFITSLYGLIIVSVVFGKILSGHRIIKRDK